MTKATEAWAALNTALMSTEPECLNDGRFVLDDQPAESLAYICNECPLFTLCETYAATARPTGGVWARRRWARKPQTNPRKKVSN